MTRGGNWRANRGYNRGRPWFRGRNGSRGRGRGRGNSGNQPENIEAGDRNMDIQVNAEDNDNANLVTANDARRQFRKRGGANRGRFPGEHAVLNPERETSSDSEDDHRKMQRGTRLEKLYPDWPDYLPNTKYKKGCYAEKVLLAFIIYLKGRHNWQKSVMENGFFFVDFEKVTTDPLITSDEHLGPSFSNLFQDSPSDTIAAIGLAAHQILITEAQIDFSQRSKNQAICAGVYPILARMINLGTHMPFRTLRADSYAQLVFVCGTIVRMSSIRPVCVEMAFKCLGCGEETTVPIMESSAIADKLQPTKCRPVSGARRCLGRSFVACPHSSNTLFVDARTLRIQEVACNDDEARDAIPRCIDVELQRDLVDLCSPGDVISICGIVRLRPAKEVSYKSIDESSEFRLCIEANSVKHHSDVTTAQAGITASQQQQQQYEAETHEDGNSKAPVFSEMDLQAFREIKNEPNVFRLLVQSLCPEIYGHELIKAGLVLALFAGRSEDSIHREAENESQMSTTLISTANDEQDFTPAASHQETRDNIHVLIVGDPGLGKSQLLRSLSDCAPRVVYVCGSSASVAGLGVAVNRDRSTLQAGALVLADRGICCIDELDKMGGQESVLLEVMEQQTLSVAKAGFVCSLPARCSIIAAANPSGGRYNHDKSIAENIKLPGACALLSRFDLVFCILDQHDADHDRMLSEHVIAAYTNSGKSGRSHFNTSHNTSITSSCLSQAGGKSLVSRLSAFGEELDLLPHHLFRKYVNYSVQTVHPKLSPGAAILLKNHYLEMRQKASNFADAPVTTRQLESMIRLAECRARVELREEVTESDARDIIDLMTGTLADVFSNKTTDLVQLRPTGGAAAGRQTIARRLIPLLQRHCEHNGSNYLTQEDIVVASGPMRLGKEKLVEAIEILNNQGYLIKKAGRYCFQSSTF